MESVSKAKITGLKLENVKRIKLVEIQPAENGLTIIGGNNGEGKTSVLDGIAYALGGESFRPSALTNGDGNAYIRVDIGDYTVERKGKNAELRITDRNGMKGGQKMLNEIVGKFALDLSKFMNANDLEKTKLLLKMFPELETMLDEYKRESEQLRGKRTDINRDIVRMQAQYDMMPFHSDVPEAEIQVSDLIEQLNAESQKEKDLEEKRRNAEAISCNLKAMEEQYNSMTDTLESLRSQIKTLEANVQANVTSAKQMLEQKRILAEEIENAPASRRAEITEQINHASAINDKILQNRNRKSALANLEALRKESETLTSNIDEIESRRKATLQKADLPLPELSITDEGELLYHNQKWDCMSGAERLKVATAICMEAKPECGFVLIDGLEAMDGKTLDEFSRFLAEKNMQGIGTIVGENERATIILEDGRVKDAGK
ncbi:MAG: AAA family ATPase [Victivallales bacterium]